MPPDSIFDQTMRFPLGHAISVAPSRNAVHSGSFALPFLTRGTVRTVLWISVRTVCLLGGTVLLRFCLLKHECTMKQARSIHGIDVNTCGVLRGRRAFNNAQVALPYVVDNSAAQLRDLFVSMRANLSPEAIPVQSVMPPTAWRMQVQRKGLHEVGRRSRHGRSSR
jgi:hypothetical protein